MTLLHRWFTFPCWYHHDDELGWTTAFSVFNNFTFKAALKNNPSSTKAETMIVAITLQYVERILPHSSKRYG